jgi:transitional endoplasmic reticulum ATPase
MSAFGRLLVFCDSLGKQASGYMILFMFVIVPTFALWGTGTTLADHRTPQRFLAPDVATAVALACLVLMVVGVWTARARSLVFALVGAVIYCVAGFGLVWAEVYGAASSTMGFWPSGKERGDLWFSLKLWVHLQGLLMLLGAASVPFVFALALQGRRKPSSVGRVAITGNPEGGAEPTERARRSLAVQPRVKLDDLAGMEDLKAQLRDFCAPFRAYHRKKAQIADTNGLLLSGPPGNGKSVFAEALAGELGFNFIKLSVQDLTSRWINESPVRIQEAFQDAVSSEPCVLFLDEIDAVGKSRSSLGSSGHSEDTKVVDTLLTEIDKVRRHRVLLVAATNFLDELDRALVRDGRFDRKIEVPLPDLPARAGVLRSLLRKYRVEVSEEAVQTAAALWERRSVAFIENVAKRVRDELAKTGENHADVLRLKAAARAVSRREGAIPRTGAKLSDLVLPPALRRDAASIVYRLKNWEALAERGATPPKGILLYGPPGTGKTNLVRAMARELGDWHVFEVKTAEILADPRRFQEVVQLASEHRPAFVFIDEADDLLRDRSFSAGATATNEILKAMDGLMGAIPEVVFLAATNNPEAIDAAATRGGRFGEKLHVDVLRGGDLLSFVRADLQRRRGVALSPDLTAEWIAAAVGEIGPADLIATIDRAINATVAEDPPRAIGRSDVAEAFTATTGRLIDPV